MSVLDCLYLVVSRPCSSLLSFPWTFLHGWERSFLCPSFSKPSLTSWDLPSSWHGLCAPSPPLSCLLSLCVPDRKWDKTSRTERLFFWGFFGGCFYYLRGEQRCSHVGLSTDFSPFKPNVSLWHSCLQETLPWCPKGSSKFVKLVQNWFIHYYWEEKEEITSSFMTFF